MLMGLYHLQKKPPQPTSYPPVAPSHTQSFFNCSTNRLTRELVGFDLFARGEGLS